MIKHKSPFNRHIAMLMALLLCASFISGKTMIRYRGQVDEAAGPVPDGFYALTFTLVSADAPDVNLWREMHKKVLISNALFTVLLGEHAALPDRLAGEKAYLLRIDGFSASGTILRAEKPFKLEKKAGLSFSPPAEPASPACVRRKGDLRCPPRMCLVGDFCIDVHEACLDYCGGSSPGCNQLGCAGHGRYLSKGDVTGSGTTAIARSFADRHPDRNITWFQAQQACVNGGKRLCTHGEWQLAALGTPDPTLFDPGDPGGSDCNVNSGGAVSWKAGGRQNCVSGYGVKDMVGNLWEWTADWRNANNRDLDPFSMTQKTSFPPGEGDRKDHMLYAGDAPWQYPPGSLPGVPLPRVEGLPPAIVKGGCYDSQAGSAQELAVKGDAGVFASTLEFSLAYHDDRIGFRCCAKPSQAKKK